MREPDLTGSRKYHEFSLGDTNNLNIPLVRNALFEPSMFRFGIKDPVNRCLSDMAIAFRMHKPAIICSHRINYVGYIVESNRDRTISMLCKLLSIAIKKWPDIEFMTSNQLGSMINNQEKRNILTFMEIKRNVFYNYLSIRLKLSIFRK